MKKITGYILLPIAITFLFSFDKSEKEKINWISIEQLNEVYAKNPKPLLIDIYTDWCGWCKQMDKTTYQHEKLSNYINEKYYAVKFNAEQKEQLTFNKKIYKYNAQYKTNELAIFLTGGQLSYPTTVFMGGIETQPAPLPGYMKPKQMEGPLKFFGERADITQTFVAFNKKLHTEW